MRGAIFYSGKYGSTEQYAKWISEATGLHVFDIKDPNADPSRYEYVILGSSILFFKLTIRKWARANLINLDGKPMILFSVSGAGPSSKLNRWICNSLPSRLISQLEHVALRGKLDHAKINWWIRKILWIGSLFNSDRDARRDERYGFDYVDKESIAPVIELVRQYELNVTAGQ